MKTKQKCCCVNGAFMSPRKYSLKKSQQTTFKSKSNFHYEFNYSTNDH